jgi:hypothetical protein
MKPVSARALAGLILIATIGSANAECRQSAPGYVSNYEGTIGPGYRVRVSLVFQPEGRLEGEYFYASKLRDIPLRGAITDGRDVTLEEIGASGKVTAIFTATFPERDPGGPFGDSPLQCEVIRGTWQAVGSDKALPVDLRMESATAGSLAHRYQAIGVADDEVVHRRAQAFWRAVQHGDKRGAAAQVRYPIDVIVNGQRRRFANAGELRAAYDEVFTERFREAIARGLPRNMFVRDQGAMLGDGAVWFGADGRVIALNPT